MKIIKTLSAISVFIFLFVLLPRLTFASTLYLSPASKSVGQGGTFTAQVRLSTKGEAVNAVSALLSYPADKLTVVGVGYGSSAFGIQAESSYGGGGIKISRGSLSPVSGDVGVATISFRAISKGSATVAFNGGSNVPRFSDSSNSLGGTAGGTYTIGAAAPASDKKTPTQAVLPQISDIAVSNISTNSATISWTTDTKTDSYVEYGLETGQYLLNVSDTKLTTTHTIKINGPLLIPGGVFHFRVRSKDLDDNEAVSGDQIFHLVGYKVKVKVLDDVGNPLSNTEVLLYSDPQKAFTDGSGEALFDGVTPGKHLLVAKSGILEKTMEIDVAGAITAIPQSVDLKMGRVPSLATNTSLNLSNINPVIIGIVVFLVVAIIAAVILIKRSKKPPTPSNTSQSNIVVGSSS